VIPHAKKSKNIRFLCYRKCTFYKTNMVEIVVSALVLP